MGADFSSHQVFCGDGNYISHRNTIVKSLARDLVSEGYVPAENEEGANGSFVVGPPGRWLHIGDSSGSTEYADLEAFETISRAMSLVYPVVNIQMSDDAAIHFYLYRNGLLSDKFGNMDFPFMRFATDEVAREFQGHPEQWIDLLLDEGHTADLRAAWTQSEGASADTILDTTAALLGWLPELVRVGYTYDIEGVPIKWNEYLKDEIDLSGFEEFHWIHLR